MVTVHPLCIDADENRVLRREGRARHAGQTVLEPMTCCILGRNINPTRPRPPMNIKGEKNKKYRPAFTKLFKNFESLLSETFTVQVSLDWL